MDWFVECTAQTVPVEVDIDSTALCTVPAKKKYTDQDEELVLLYDHSSMSHILIPSALSRETIHGRRYSGIHSDYIHDGECAAGGWTYVQSDVAFYVHGCAIATDGCNSHVAPPDEPA